MMTTTKSASSWTLPVLIDMASPVAIAWQCDVEAHMCNNNCNRDTRVHFRFKRGDTVHGEMFMYPGALDELPSLADVRADVERMTAMALTMYHTKWGTPYFTRTMS